ncbi:tetratricopeptide repeat protein [Streptomyces sp. NPDC088360]|uniref:tetratricopeptide repeat protein n=1 Tax=unclassified Streptomyces TaxID=2593676 RepID=UPI00344F0981
MALIGPLLAVILLTAVPAGAKSGELSWPKWLVAGLVAVSGVLVAIWTPMVNAWVGAMANRTSRAAESAAQAQDALERMPGGGKVPLAEEVTDRAQLGIHEALPLPVGAAEKLGLSPELPSYVPRDVDADLRTALQAMTTTGGFVLLIGPAAAGKTRCAWEAIRAVLPKWRFLMPATAVDLTALADGGTDLKHRVIWLNETQQYLTGPDPLRASTLRRILADRAHPVILVGTIWPDTYEQLRTPTRETRESEEGSESREDLNQNSRDALELARRFRLTSWSVREKERAQELAPLDPRIAQAAGHGGPTGLSQALSAAPELIHRWELADDPYGQAVITAAVAARRCGHPPLLSSALLAELAQEYLTGPQRAAADAAWFPAALQWACRPVLNSGGIAPLQPHADAVGQPVTYAVSDILTDHTTPDLSGPPEQIPTSIWTRLISLATPHACTPIGATAYFAGRHVQAHTFFHRAADAGDAEAMFILGALFGEQQDEESARTWYTRAADDGHTGAMNNLGALLAEQQDAEGARTWFIRAADIGHTGAMNNLGVLLRDQGDVEGARIWFTRAAGPRHTDAMFNLGVLLHDQQDTAQALTWFTRAADAGHTDAMFNLGVLLRGQGDKEGARTWYTRAADNGHTRAMNNLGALASEQQDAEGARTWYARAADAGHTGAMINLGIQLRDQGDVEGARGWYAKAVTAGDTRAMGNLGFLLYEEGDAEGARTWYARAADAGHTDAMLILGVLLQNQGDKEGARAWYTQAVKGGHTGASRNLAALEND